MSNFVFCVGLSVCFFLSLYLLLWVHVCTHSCGFLARYKIKFYSLSTHLTNYLGFFLEFVLEILKHVGSAAPYSFALSYLCLLSLFHSRSFNVGATFSRRRTRSAARTVTADGRHQCCHCIVIVTVVNVVVAIVAAAQWPTLAQISCCRQRSRVGARTNCQCRHNRIEFLWRWRRTCCNGAAAWLQSRRFAKLAGYTASVATAAAAQLWCDQCAAS